MNKCKNCKGEIIFNPKEKGNQCKSCGSVFPIKYNYGLPKKTFEQSAVLNEDKPLNTLTNIKCNSCGASIIVNKQQLQAQCPYCGDTSLVQNNKSKLMNIDSIIPFSFGKAEALKNFKAEVSGRFFAKKNLFKNVSESDIKGTYINAFVFDFVTTTTYKGVFTYSRTVRDKNGKTKTETVRKHVSGVFAKTFNNLTVEANSNFNQSDLTSIEPYKYDSAVEFQEDFMNGYMLEYQDSAFNDCVKTAEDIMNADIKKELLRKHNCDRIESIDMSVSYQDRKYNYCLLPVYFFNVEDKKKGKTHKVVMNGQTAKVGKVPSDVGKILFVVFGIIGIVAAIVLLSLLFVNNINKF